MWVITHTLSGMALGALLVDRGVGLLVIVPGALLLHLILDIVPHWDYTSSPHFVRWASADVAASGIALAIAGIAGVGWIAIVAGAVSAAPDLDVLNTLRRTRRSSRFFPSHMVGFPHGRAAPVPGTIVQAVVGLVSVAMLVSAGA